MMEPSFPAAGPAPRVSVLLPCYNGGEYLDAAIRSILDQTMSDLELVVVDDGSTDGSADRVRQFADSDPRVRLVSKPNGGIVSALNAGLALCRGEFVARMDADDISYPSRLSAQVDWLDTHPGCVCVGGLAVDDPIPTAQSRRTSGGHHARTDLGVFPPRVAVSMHPLITVRRAAFVALGGYRDGYRHAEDYDLFIRLAQFGTIDNPPIDMLYYRRHEGAISIRNVDQQEQSAVRAEVDAIVAAGTPAPSAVLLDAYLRLRIWRRYQSVDPTRAAALAPAIRRDLFRLSPSTLLSVRYFRLRAIIVRALLRWQQRKRTAAVAQSA